MYISKKDRAIIRHKFDGRCAYSGTVLEDDWQVDHVAPVRRNFDNKTAINEKSHCLANLFPAQKLINHYKHSMDLELFRTWYLGKLHIRLQELPKNPRTKKSQKRKEYILKIAMYFGITENEPFNGVFYFERMSSNVL